LGQNSRNKGGSFSDRRSDPLERGRKKVGGPNGREVAQVVDGEQVLVSHSQPRKKKKKAAVVPTR